MVLGEYYLNKSEHEFLPKYELHQKSISSIGHQKKKRIKKANSKNFKNCPYCHKTKLKGQKALEQHIQAKHSMNYQIRRNDSKKEYKIRKFQIESKFSQYPSSQHSFRCPLCHKKFHTSDQVYSHYHNTHHQNTALLDENLSHHVANVQQIATLFSIMMIPLPEIYHGKSDNTILNFLISMNVGLITRDKYFAKKAMLFVSPVFLIWQNSIIKLA
ncbi:MAG: hypothetical protein ACTSWC_11580 [Promethearchaeota archaeon]